MTIVERYPSFNWAFGRFVTHTEDGRLWVAGGSPYWAFAKDDSCHDLLAEYRKAQKTVWGQGRTGKNSPHIQFANASTDEKLIAFVEQFGAVVARSVRETVETIEDGQLNLERVPDPPILVAEQDMNELRNERIIYRAALALLAELKSVTKADIAVIQDCISKIATGVSVWPEQRKREQQWRAMRNEAPIPWDFSEKTLRRVETKKWMAVDPPLTIGDRIAGEAKTDQLTVGQTGRVMGAGHDILCELVNAFKPWVYHSAGGAFEGPHWDRRYGIRPLLYDILRREYVIGGAAVCANNQCRDLFDIERAGQRFCTTECSQRQRQRDYWTARGKQMRKQREKRRQSTAKKAVPKGRK